MSAKPKENKNEQIKADHLKTLTDKLVEFSSQCIEKGLTLAEAREIVLPPKTAPKDHDRNGNSVKSKIKGKQSKSKSKSTPWSWKQKVCLVFLTLGVASAGLAYYLEIHNLDDLMATIRMEADKCILYNNGALLEVARPLVDCGICNTLQGVPIEEDISTEVFLQKYAYTGVPVLIKNGTKNWSAMSTFSFQFFKDLYTQTDGALQSVEEECQFFPYKTEFDTLADVFNMSDARATFEDGEKPWYIGWSNCHGDVKETLRKHYQRPFFLPNDSESSTIDWMFMGGSGLGAFIHLDYVERPSWQAQISGQKTWTLVPSPECEAQCISMNVTVHKGDIFVIDTNVWYHATYIHPGEISITIGSEYD